MYRNNWLTMLLAATVSTVVAVGCGPEGPGSGASSSSTGSGGSGGSGGAGGSGGSGGSMVVDPGKPGGALVNAGNTVSSPNYKMVFTLGQSTPTQTTVESPGYRMRGGLIGATSGK